MQMLYQPLATESLLMDFIRWARGRYEDDGQVLEMKPQLTQETLRKSQIYRYLATLLGTHVPASDHHIKVEGIGLLLSCRAIELPVPPPVAAFSPTFSSELLNQ